jgi:hypothetical protein
MNFIWIGVAAAIGGIVKGLIGWSRSNEAFSGRKFLGTALTALLSGLAASLVYSAAVGIGLPDIIVAFLAGAGVDNLRKEVVNNIRAKMNGGNGEATS